MKYLISLLVFLIGGCSTVNSSSISDTTSLTQTVDSASIDIIVKNNAGPTILYIPGCNGLDKSGRQYQQYHLKKFQEVWPNANIVISQYVNDYTKGEANGKCDWTDDNTRLVGRQISNQAEHTQKLGDWIKTQPWSNGDVHLFGFSFGGAIGLWAPAHNRSTVTGKPKLFKTVALIWPDCRPVLRQFFGNIHTPLRIWSTENDPLSVPKNCPSFYTDTDKKLILTLYPGNTHSWMTSPYFQPFTKYWPNQKITVQHEFKEEWANETFKEWQSWALLQN